MNLTNIVVHKRRKTEKSTYWMISFMKILANEHKVTESKSVVAWGVRDGREGIGWYVYYLQCGTSYAHCTSLNCTQEIHRVYCLQLYCVLGHSVVSDSLQPHGLLPTKLLCPWSFQARILEWVAISYSSRSSPPRDWTCISCVFCVGRKILYSWATWEACAGYSFNNLQHSAVLFQGVWG